MNVTKIITSLGGSPAVALALKVPRTTVDSWRRNNKVPAWRLEAFRALAKQAKPVRRKRA